MSSPAGSLGETVSVRTPHIVRPHRYGGGAGRLFNGDIGVAAGVDSLPTVELDILARGPAQTVGAQAGLVAVSESFPPSLTDRFLDRAFVPERAVLEPSRNQRRSR